MHVTAILAAGGRGERFGGAEPKQLATVAGRAILERSVAAFVAHPEISEVVVALPVELAANPPAYLTIASKPLRIVAGGARRRDSVMNAFRAASDRSEVIVIHDAARPFASAALISRTIAAAAESGAALAAVQARDTVKRVSRPDVTADATEARMVAETLPRESIILAQTPHAFRRGVLRDALALAGTLVGGDRRGRAGGARRPPGAARRRRSDEHQDHHARRSPRGGSDRERRGIER